MNVIEGKLKKNEMDVDGSGGEERGQSFEAGYTLYGQCLVGFSSLTAY